MFCEECGKEVHDEAVVCVHCGCALKKSIVKTSPQKMFIAPFSFDGRIRRFEYGLSFIIMYISALSIGFFIGYTGMEEGVMYLLLIPVYWFMWAQGSKRCHDRGNSGWFQIIPFYSLWMFFADGELSDNEYGSNPKGLNYN
jgi:uncharacterized membrane protein YhaH (DUF805 family)